MAEVLAGVAYFKVNGMQFALRGAFKVQPNATKATSIVGQDQFHGLKVEPIAAYIEGDVTDMGGFAVTSLPDLVGVPVTAELANGKIYVMPDGNYVDVSEIDTEEGKVKVRFEGPVCQELLAA
jgi:hypothetical protein